MRGGGGRRTRKKSKSTRSDFGNGRQKQWRHSGVKLVNTMGIVELEARVAEIRSQPMHVVCVTPKGRMKVMTVRECMESGAHFLHVVADELDKLLADELGGGEVQLKENHRKPNLKRGRYP